MESIYMQYLDNCRINKRTFEKNTLTDIVAGQEQKFE